VNRKKWGNLPEVSMNFNFSHVWSKNFAKLDVLLVENSRILKESGVWNNCRPKEKNWKFRKNSKNEQIFYDTWMKNKIKYFTRRFRLKKSN
jgi:hypothetical protein